MTRFQISLPNEEESWMSFRICMNEIILYFPPGMGAPLKALLAPVWVRALRSFSKTKIKYLQSR